METIRELDDEECCGEHKCLSKRSKPLNSYLNLHFQQNEIPQLIERPPQEIINTVCGNCPLFPTKPGNEPVEIASTLNSALELEELFGIGFKPSFADVMNGALNIKQIAALKGLKNGRDLAQSARNQDTKKKIKQQQSQNNPKPQRSASNSFD